MHAHRPIVYLASPYTHGDQCLNVRAQHEMFYRLLKEGVVYPHAPLWSHYQNLYQPIAWETWLDFDKALLLRFDALYRFSAKYPALDYFEGKSLGADQEEGFCRAHGIPVFYTLDLLYDWAKFEYIPPAGLPKRVR